MDQLIQVQPLRTRPAGEGLRSNGWLQLREVQRAAPDPLRPDWLKVRARMGPHYQELKGLARGLGLHTICEEAHCPNIFECWEQRTATFLILGRVCTRACRFCAVETGRPTTLDLEEPERLAEAVRALGLKHVVITSVARDDLEDGGASVFAASIRKLREGVPDCQVEVLIPDLQGSEVGLGAVVKARPDVLNHNVETVRRLQRRVRAKAFYERSLWVLRRSKELDRELIDGRLLTKSGMMLGVGETREEIEQTMADLRAIEVDVFTIGQYLRPSPAHLPIERYVPPEEFAELRNLGLNMGFRHVEAGPLVRSSYHARRHVEGAGV